MIAVSITADNKEVQVDLPLGSTVQEALKSAQIELGESDRVDPPLYTVLSVASSIRVIRVTEEFYTEQVVIPFEHQELKNEALSEGDSRMSQTGVNGLQEVTHRRVIEDGVEVREEIVNTTVLKEPVPEVVMVGSQPTFTSFKIPGRIAYLSNGNGWVIESTTGNRYCAVCTGDLDGRIFALSNDRNFLLFTRLASGEKQINSLWVAALQSNPIALIDLGIKNVVHYAEFAQGSNRVAYSTAEWRETAPGWQANNDLYELNLGANDPISSTQLVLTQNSGGVYGWWGTQFFLAPNTSRFLYSRPDSIGIVDVQSNTQTPIHSIAPYQTGGDWAWVPPSAWAPDGNTIFTVNHVSSEANGGSISQQFDLFGIPLTGGAPVSLVKNVGMFAYPVPSPMYTIANFINDDSGDAIDQTGYTIAYLQAIIPDQSETSSYRLYIIDRDGSNKKGLFPEETSAGMEPQRIAWSPEPLGNDGNYAIALIYNGNIWIIDVSTGAAQQVTGDGLTDRVDWR